jgi:hypothetical protein
LVLKYYETSPDATCNMCEKPLKDANVAKAMPECCSYVCCASCMLKWLEGCNAICPGCRGQTKKIVYAKAGIDTSRLMQESGLKITKISNVSSRTAHVRQNVW